MLPRSKSTRVALPLCAGLKRIVLVRWPGLYFGVNAIGLWYCECSLLFSRSFGLSRCCFQGVRTWRLRSVSSSLDSAMENTVAANSQVRDLDMAEALSAQARESILQQSGIAILIQANAQPQAALSLIG